MRQPGDHEGLTAIRRPPNRTIRRRGQVVEGLVLPPAVACDVDDKRRIFELAS
jgi:hypothetical protein